MQFRLLGPVECVVDGQPIALGRVQERCLLAVLLLDNGQVVPVSRLIELLWDGVPPARAQSIVQTLVSRVRAALRAAGADEYGVRVLTRAGGYTIEVPPDSVDAQRFRRMVQDARAESDVRRRAAALRRALDQWRGPAIADATTAALRDQLCASLEELRVAALEDAIEADLDLGRHRDLVAELTALVARYPLRERFIGQLMRALYRSGQQSRALAVYREARQRLLDELGIEPAAELRRLELAVLTQDAALDECTGHDPARRTSPTWIGPRSHLSQIVGRQPDLTSLVALLRSHRLLTVVGPGGVGKTTLALHAAEQLASTTDAVRDVVVAALGPAVGEDGVVVALGALLGIRAGSVAEMADGIETAFRDRPHLLVLDNCEHLVDACARTVRRLLAACPELTVLATSRIPLGVPEEAVVRLDPLPVPDRDEPASPAVPAMALFLQRARESLPGFVPDAAELDAIARICRRVDGLPLALELAAARLRTLPAVRLAEELDGGLRLLTQSADAPSPLVATLDWSYLQLPAPERQLLTRLSVFRGGFDGASAAAVCGADPLKPGQVLPLIAALVDRSLVQPYDTRAGRRYRLLEVVRDYAGGRLEALDPKQETADRHLDHWLRRVQSIATRPLFGEQVRGWADLDDDLDNLRAAAEHGYTSGRTADVVELTTLLFDFWAGVTTRHAELARWYQRAAPHFAACRPEVRCIAEFNQVCLSGLLDDNVGALTVLRRIIPELRRHRPERDYLEARITEVRMLTRMQDPAAPDRAADVFELVRAATDPHYRLHSTAMFAEALITWGRYDEAAEICSGTCDADAANSGDRIRVLAMRALAALGRGDFAGAAAADRRQQELRGREGDYLHIATSSLPQALLALATLTPARARDAIADIVTTLERHYPATMSSAYAFQIWLAHAEWRLGRPDAALRLLARSLPHGFGRSDYTKTMPGVLVAALIASDLGDEEGTALGSDWDQLRRRHGLPAPLGLAAFLPGLGIDPAAPRIPSGARWDDKEPQDLILRTQAWCMRAGSNSG
ncbi:BTAD domain-containing putative transcriptional regulator [Kribbella sp. NPDC048915]|uniref:BTAD domain-containing putative transcriptional regulator n=1 Tax=Kribbella sp. NPDC048915 TaxID=3155148 RepID=UPI0033FC6472